MIHYHGSPCSGPADCAGRFYAGRHAMVSFAYPEQLDAIALVSQSFVLDNGAFTAWKQGGAVDVPSYAEWVREWAMHPGFTWCLIPDVIDGDASDNDELIHEWTTHYGSRIPSVPVWHLHESADRLRALAGRFPCVALGSSGKWSDPGTDGWWDRLRYCLPAILDEQGRPYCKLHGLRMLNPEIFMKLPLASADSTNAAQNAGRPLARLPMAWQRANAIADWIESSNSPAQFTGASEQYLELAFS